MKLTPTQMRDRAATIAVRAHHGQVRKDGSDYISHPIIVAMNVKGGPVADTVALLHDVLEDSPWTLEELREEGFSEEVLSALDAVTKRKGEKYSDFIDRVIAGGLISISVKIADVNHNLADQSALDPDEAKFLKTRYVEAKRKLYDALLDIRKDQS